MSKVNQIFRDGFFTTLFLALILLPLQKVFVFSRPWNGWEILFAVVLLTWYALMHVYNICPTTTRRFFWLISFLFILFIAGATLNLYLLALTIPLLFFTARRSHTLLAIILMTGVLVSSWGISQFVIQRNVGFKSLGETVFSNRTTGIAKFSSNDSKLVRSYGPYPHANILSGSLALSLMAGGILMLRTRHNALLPMIVVVFLGLLTTFSRAAWLSAMITICVLTYYSLSSRFVLVKRMMLLILLLFTITTLVFTPLMLSRLHDPQDQGITSRVSGLQYGFKIFVQQSVFHGIGVGLYPKALESYLDSHGISYNSWDIAPLHSTPLLILLEWGVLPSLALCVLVITPLRRSLRYSWAFLMPALPLLFFDHYFITQTTSVLLLMAFVAAVVRLPERELSQRLAGAGQ